MVMACRATTSFSGSLRLSNFPGGKRYFFRKFDNGGCLDLISISTRSTRILSLGIINRSPRGLLVSARDFRRSDIIRSNNNHEDANARDASSPARSSANSCNAIGTPVQMSRTPIARVLTITFRGQVFLRVPRHLRSFPPRGRSRERDFIQGRERRTSRTDAISGIDRASGFPERNLGSRSAGSPREFDDEKETRRRYSSRRSQRSGRRRRRRRRWRAAQSE